MTTEEILEVADQYLEYSDFGNFYGSEDSIVEFAAAILRKAELEE